ncbi:MAG: DUF2345 domain-containing protein, partial [Dechloromonas sp.]
PLGCAPQEDPLGCAPGDDRSGTWVRVAEWLSGPNWGSHFLPRIGTEVLIDYLDGDIDRPVVVGQAHNGADQPPFAAGHEAAANHPGVLAGWMSHNFEAGYNQWVIDDAPGQLRTRLATSANISQLSLGHLIHQAPDSATRGAWRGSGFELRSDAWLAVRAGEGLLLSATARPDGQSTQMDVSEAVGQLKAAEETAQALSDAAAGQTALPLKANAEQSQFRKTIDPAEDGQYTGSIGGQEAKKARPGSREAGDPTERFAAPHLVAEAPGDIGLASPGSTVLYAGRHLHATIQQDFHLASAHTVALAVGEGASWYSHQGGIKSIAQAGSHSIQAHSDAMEILADQSITVTSSNDEIHLLAKDKIVLQAGQSSVTLEGQNITFACPGTFSVKGSNQAFLGPGNGAAELESLPTGNVAQQAAPAFTEASYSGQYELFKTDNRPFEGYDYEIRSNRSGKTLGSGKSDSAGFAKLVTTPQEERITAYKSIKRESERITENWQGKLAAAVVAASSRSGTGEG